MAGTDDNNVDSGAASSTATPPPGGAGAAPGTPPQPTPPAASAPTPDATTAPPPQVSPNYGMDPYSSISLQSREVLPPVPDAQLQAMKRDSWGIKVYHGILNALGGAQDVSFNRDPTTGKMIASTTASGPGQQWKQIISGALTGLAAGAGQTGPGSTARKFGMGFQAGDQRVQQNYQRKQQEANEDFDAQQKAATSNLNRAVQAHNLARSVFQLGEDKIAATQTHLDNETNLEKAVDAGGAGSTMMGIFPDFASANAAFLKNKALHPELANGRMIPTVHVDADGNIAGVAAALVTPTWLESKVNMPLPITWRYMEDGKEKTTTYTIPANSLTGDKFSNLVMKTSQDELDNSVKQQDIANKTLTAKGGYAKDMAEAHKAEADTTAGPRGMSENEDADEGLATGRYIMGKDFPTRTSKDQATAQERARTANQYSIQHFGLRYSPEIIRQEAKFAEDKRTQAYLDSIDSMLGDPGGNNGQLDQLLRIAQQAGIGKSNAPYQETRLKIKKFFGENTAKKFDQLRGETQSSLGALIGNPLLGGGETDKKLAAAQEQFGQNVTMGNLPGAIDNVREVLERRRAVMAKQNRYIQMRYGQAYSPAQQAMEAGATPSGPAGGGAATPFTPPQAQPGAGKQVSLAAAKQKAQNAGKSDAQITSELQGLGYKVNP